MPLCLIHLSLITEKLYNLSLIPKDEIPSSASSEYNQCILSRFSHVQLFVTLRTVACQAPLSVGFPSQEYQSGLPFPSPEDLPDVFPAFPVLAGRFFTTEPPGKTQ